MFLAKLSIQKPVMVTMGLLVFIVFGILGFIDMPLNLMPDIQIPYMIVQTVYPGAGPAEIENQVTKKIEDAVATVGMIEFIESYTMENLSLVAMKFRLGKDINIANQEVKDKVDAILRDFPSDVEKPIVQKIDITAQPFMDLILSGNLDGKELRELAEKKIQDRFTQIEGVAQMELVGGNKRQIDVKFNDKVVYENKLSLMQLSQILAIHNLDMPAGHFIKGSQEYSVRLKGEFQDIEAIRNASVPTASGVKKLHQIAEVTDSEEEVRTRATFFDVPKQQKMDNIIRISLTNAADGNIVDIAKQVRERLPEIQSELPAGVKLNIINDNSDFIQASVNDTMGNIWMGILLTGLILLLFLHDLRSTLIVALSMPFSILSTFVFLKASGFTINIMTLMGLSTSVGILVSNSVVVIENIFRHKNMGNKRKEASDIGTSEIAVAVIASTLTNIVVFLPIASMSSMVGQFFKEFGLTVTYATIFSLITSFTIVPMLASRILPEHETNNKFSRGFNRFFDGFTRYYTSFLSGILKSKKRSFGILGLSALVLIISFVFATRMGVELFPNLDQGDVVVNVELPQGDNLDQTARVIDEINKRIAKHKEVKHVVTNLGSQGYIDQGTNLAAVNVKLIDSSQRDFSSQDFVSTLMQELADIPNARLIVSAQMGVGGGGSPIEFYLQGQDNEQLELLKPEVMKLVSSVPGVQNLDTSTRTGKPELTVYPNREKMAEIGASVFDLAMALRLAIEGSVATQYREQGNEYDIKLSLNDDSVDSPEKIRNLSISINGNVYTLSQLADLDFASGVNKITHRDRYKTIQFTGGVTQGYNLGNITNEIKKVMEEIKLPPNYRFAWGGDASMLEETMVDMIRTFILAILLTYMLLAAILESFAQPLLIMSTVPLALIGVIFSLLITGVSINIFSMMAIIMLVGIVVNNAILILDYVNMKRREGVNSHDALTEAGKMKLKPIIMSTLSIVIGMMPMALGIGSAGKEFRQSMGIVSIGGLMVSTFLTLVIIPAFYYITTKNIGIDKRAETE